MTPRHYIFVDFENVHEVQLELIANRPVEVILVLGERHKKLSLDLVQEILKYSDQVKLVEAGLSGRNALDFVLAYLVGVRSTKDNEGHFHILSRDKGFNALVEHLKKNKILADRHESFDKIPILAAGSPGVLKTGAPAKAATPPPARKKSSRRPAPSLPDRAAETITWLQHHPLNRPKTQKRLLSHLYTHFGKRVSMKELQTLLEELVAGDAIEITPQGKVLYKI